MQASRKVELQTQLQAVNDNLNTISMEDVYSLNDLVCQLVVIVQDIVNLIPTEE